jgi:hypothetical protein
VAHHCVDEQTQPLVGDARALQPHLWSQRVARERITERRVGRARLAGRGWLGAAGRDRQVSELRHKREPVSAASRHTGGSSPTTATWRTAVFSHSHSARMHAPLGPSLVQTPCITNAFEVAVRQKWRHPWSAERSIAFTVVGVRRADAVRSH